MSKDDGNARAERDKRLEAALRANLKRRKEQQRERDNQASEENNQDDS